MDDFDKNVLKECSQKVVDAIGGYGYLPKLLANPDDLSELLEDCLHLARHVQRVLNVEKA